MKQKCWICGSFDLKFVKPSNIQGALASEDFAITDYRYGTTGELHQCKQCGFLQCTDIDDVLTFYENLADPAYETGRRERAIQSRKILETAHKFCPTGRLLDIGAGSGILVEQALQMGYSAEGIEPSKWLQNQAQQKYHLPVLLGTFPNHQQQGPYDIVTIIDVIEHVSDPVQLLKDVMPVLATNGIVIVVTPDVSSVIPRLLKWKWWHFRVAHIGYFNNRTLQMAAEHAGFKPVAWRRPGWYFPADYLLERLMSYLPKTMRLTLPEFLHSITVPLNLYDSTLCVLMPDAPKP